MNELCITIHNVTDAGHEALIRHIKRTLYDYDPELQVTIPESSLWLSSRKGHSRLYYSECYFIETESRHLLFHCTDKVIRKKGRICELLKRLPEDTFFGATTVILSIFIMSAKFCRKETATVSGFAPEPSFL